MVPLLWGKRAQRARLFSRIDAFRSHASRRLSSAFKSQRRFADVAARLCPFSGCVRGRTRKRMSSSRWGLFQLAKRLEDASGMASDDAEAREAQEAEEDLRIFETLCISSPRKVNRWQRTHCIFSHLRPVVYNARAFTKAHTHAHYTHADPSSHTCRVA